MRNVVPGILIIISAQAGEQLDDTVHLHDLPPEIGVLIASALIKVHEPTADGILLAGDDLCSLGSCNKQLNQLVNSKECIRHCVRTAQAHTAQPVSRCLISGYLRTKGAKEDLDEFVTLFSNPEKSLALKECALPYLAIAREECERFALSSQHTHAKTVAHLLARTDNATHNLRTQIDEMLIAQSAYGQGFTGYLQAGRYFKHGDNEFLSWTNSTSPPLQIMRIHKSTIALHSIRMGKCKKVISPLYLEHNTRRYIIYINQNLLDERSLMIKRDGKKLTSRCTGLEFLRHEHSYIQNALWHKNNLFVHAVEKHSDGSLYSCLMKLLETPDGHFAHDGTYFKREPIDHAEDVRVLAIHNEDNILIGSTDTIAFEYGME